MISKLYVHVDLGDGNTMLAGQLIVDKKRRVTGFKYSKKYAEHPDAYPLDPINLPLATGAIYESQITRGYQGIFGALLDAGPDDWGKKVLISLLDPPPFDDMSFLLAGSGNGVGTVFFTQKRNDLPMRGHPREFTSLDDVMETALLIDEGKQVSQEKRMFFQYGSSIGGARPKTFIDQFGIDVETGRRQNRQWIVKFPRKGDLVDHATLEYCSMRMAREAGIDVPETRLMETVLGPILLVERFDVDPIRSEHHHILSARSLVNKYNIAEMTSEAVSYANIGRVAKQIGENGMDINRELFRRMLFNVAVGNIDDHLQNHAFVKKAGCKAMTLSPAYDVLPTVGMQGSPHAIAIGPLGGHPTVDNLTLGAKEMGIDLIDAAQIAEQVLKATENWEERLEQQGLEPKEIAIVGNNFKARMYVERFLESIPEHQRQQEAMRTPALIISR